MINRKTAVEGIADKFGLLVCLFVLEPSMYVDQAGSLKSACLSF